MLAETVREAARRFGERTAFAEVDGGGDGGGASLTYAQLDAHSDALAAALAHRGVGPGDVVALVLPTSAAWPVAYAALAKRGAVTAGVNTRLTVAERAAVMDRVAPALVLDDPDEVWDLVEQGVGEGAPRVAVDLDHPVAICLTSGSTGVPKGVTFAGRQLAAITRTDVGDDWGAGGVSLAATTFAHLGPMTKLPGVLRRGGTVHLLDRWSPDRALALVEQLGLTSLAGIPTQVALMLDALEGRAVDVSSLRVAVVGGGPASPALVRRIRERLGVPVCVRYACTEAGTGLGTEVTDPPEDAEETVGRPRGDVELAVRVEERDVEPGATGEVLLRSPAVMAGYHRDPEATAGAIARDGFVHTGDLGWVDERGRLHLAGRVSERYVRGGENVHPVEVEAVLEEHPAVRSAAVIGRADDTWGEVGVAVIVPVGEVPTLAELRAHAGERLARFKLPDHLVVVDRMPLTANHKIDKRALRERVAAPLRREATRGGDRHS